MALEFHFRNGPSFLRQSPHRRPRTFGWAAAGPRPSPLVGRLNDILVARGVDHWRRPDVADWLQSGGQGDVGMLSR